MLRIRFLLVALLMVTFASAGAAGAVGTLQDGCPGRVVDIQAFDDARGCVAISGQGYADGIVCVSGDGVMACHCGMGIGQIFCSRLL